MPICKYEDFLKILKEKKRILGVDHGTKRIGIAITDDKAILATPLKTIVRSNQKSDFNLLLEIINEYSIGGIVIGLPLNMNGTKGPRCQSVSTFVNNFIIFRDTPFYFQDERLSSLVIEKFFIKNNLSRKKRSINIDKHAACWILQSAIDTFKKK